ncbi:MAG TPA: glycosyltransferase family 2 protein [Lachnospiraceae bacterium]|nr:glycosyltransferase family 2 protein [Lachnospiraceae bacterium]
MKVLVIIPAYNEEESIKMTIDKLSKDAPYVDYLVVNDCSRDHTKEILEQMHASFISLPVNLGIGGAVQSGYRYALANHYDIAVQIDGDGQHDTAYLATVLEPLQKQEADVVIGSRFIAKEGFQSSGMRRAGIKILDSLIFLCTGIEIKDSTSGFRAINRTMIELYAKEYPIDYPEPEAIVRAAVEGARILEVPVVMKERNAGQSSIRPLHSAYYMLKVSIAIMLCRISNHKRRK